MTPKAPPVYALRQRLLMAAAAWIGVAVVLMAVVLVQLFQHHVEGEMADRAMAPLDRLTAGLTVVMSASADTPPTIAMQSEPGDDAFDTPYGGAYWWVTDGRSVMLRSRSWWDAEPSPRWVSQDAPLHGDAIRHLDIDGPQGQSVAVWARRVELAGWDAPLVVAVGMDTARLEGMTRAFARTVWIALGVLAGVLWLAAWLQVRVGLQPLQRLKQSLNHLNAGHSASLNGAFPAEVQPLVDDLNQLLHDNDRLVREAREQSGNFAHALKTPLAVLQNASRQWHGDQADELRLHLTQIQRQVEWQLARARATTSHRAARHTQRQADAVAVTQGLLRTLRRLHAERAIEAVCIAPAHGVRVNMEPDVLQELLGNLMDNACRWCHARVEVRLHIDDTTRMGCIDIDDDGPGIPVEHRSVALLRGQRLDETQPGSGLGMAIADELARLAGGSLQLGDAPLGGLRVTVRLPAVSPPRADNPTL